MTSRIDFIVTGPIEWKIRKALVSICLIKVCGLFYAD